VHTTRFPAGEIRGQLVAAEDIGTTDIGTPTLMGTDNLLLG
jgi:hypothetical protein